MEWCARKLCSDWLKKNGTDADTDDMYVVWFCKTLQNWKALVSTDLVKGVYFEVTHNGDKEETYVDVYKKEENYRVGYPSHARDCSCNYV